MLHLAWRASPDVYGNLIKLTCDRGSPHPLHTHEFPEIFWLDEGPCRHCVNGREEILAGGELVFVRASDQHQLIADKARRFTMTNLECQPGLMLELRRRHPEPFERWFGESPAFPAKIRLTDGQLHQLQQATRELTSRLPTSLNIEGFCLDLARLVAPVAPVVSKVSRCPEWLQDALLKAQFPEVFARGPAGLSRAAKRSAEHVARSCRQYLQQTPTEIIEQCRMLHAERQLRLTSLSILEIALDCGYATTAQFHRAFKRRYQRTPLRYRRWVRGV